MKILIPLMLLPLSVMAADKSDLFVKDYPTPQLVEKSRKDQDLQRAITAYRFFYPTVSMAAIMNGTMASGAQENRSLMYMAAGPKQILFTGNSDTPYGGGTLNLQAAGPFVVEMPPGTFVGLIDDHNQSWVTDLGIPGRDAGKGGKYLILPSDYKGKVPKGFYTAVAKTNKVYMAVRSIPQKGNLELAMDNLKKIRVYPLAAKDKIMTFVNATEVGEDSTPLAWETNIQYWENLHKIISSETMPADFAPMYGLLKAIGIEKGKDFKPDERTKKLLEQAATDGRNQMMVSGFASDRKDRLAWPDRKWEWIGLVGDNADFMTPTGMDLEARDRWFIQAIVASPAMFNRKAGTGSLYWLASQDKQGNFFDGSKSYKLNVPANVPAKLFWSVTIYDTASRSQVQTDQNRAAIRSLFEKMAKNADGSTDLYFGPTAPAGKESQWIKTLPNRGWFAYFRIYGPEQSAFNGAWKPADFEQISSHILTSVDPN